MNKLRHLIIGAILIFFFAAELRADGSPIVQSLIVQGDYLFIRVNEGLYTIHEKDGHFYWLRLIGDYFLLLKISFVIF